MVTAFSALFQIKAEAAPVDQLVLEEVIVVAQKRAQNLQHVPVAVSAFSGEQLENSGIDDVFDLSDIAPALHVRQAGQSRSTTFRIRGVGTFANNFGLESSVGLYVDGVYRSRQGSMINNMVDMASVEVLRGPQGTLYGRNTLAGAIVLNTVAPGHDGHNGFAQFTLGNYDLLNFSGASSFSAINDVLAIRASAFSSQRDGYVDEINFGENTIYDRDRWGVRLQALYTPRPSLSLRLIADYSMRNETCCAAQAVQDNLRPVALSAGATAYAGYDEVNRSLGARVFTSRQYYERKTALSQLPVSDDRDAGFSLGIDWDLQRFSVTSITGYRAFDGDSALDGDHSDLSATAVMASEEQRAWSQELRVSRVSDRLSYVAGLYYYKQRLDSLSTQVFGQDANAIWSHGFVWYPGSNGQFPLQDISSFPLPALPLFYPDSGARNSMEQDHTAYAVFGQSDYFLTDKLMLTAGLRYTQEKKNLSGIFTQGSAPEFNDNLIAADVVLDGTPSIAPQDPVDESLDDDRVTGTLKFTWFPGDYGMLYASYGTGYKAGGTNTDRIDPELDYIFDPETSRALEIGWKVEFPQQSLRLNVALHKTDIKDLQVNYAQNNRFVLQNAGKLETYGGELELTWAPTDSLAITGAYARTDGEIRDFNSSFCWIAYPFHTGRPDPGDPIDGQNPQFCDRSGEELHNNPDSLFLSANKTYQLSEGTEGFVLVEYTRIGSAESTNHDPFHTAPAYELLNLRIGIDFKRHASVLTLWGRNVLNEEYRMTGFDGAVSPGKVLATPGEPVTYGITLRTRF